MTVFLDLDHPLKLRKSSIFFHISFQKIFVPSFVSFPLTCYPSSQYFCSLLQIQMNLSCYVIGLSLKKKTNELICQYYSLIQKQMYTMPIDTPGFQCLFHGPLYRNLNHPKDFLSRMKVYGFLKIKAFSFCHILIKIL